MEDKTALNETVNLSHEQRLEFENSLLREQNLSLQIQSVQKHREQLIAEFCRNIQKKPEDILRWNLETGTVVFQKPLAKPDNK